jgi:hypothetical protein
MLLLKGQEFNTKIIICVLPLLITVIVAEIIYLLRTDIVNPTLCEVAEYKIDSMIFSSSIVFPVGIGIIGLYYFIKPVGIILGIWFLAFLYLWSNQYIKKQRR